MSENDKNINDSAKYSVDDILAETRKQKETASAQNEAPAEYDNEDKKEKKKKKKRFFGRKKDKDSDFDEKEDMYYGIQVKPLDELRKGFDSTGEIPNMDDTFARLFDDTIPSLDEEVEKNFARIQQERRRRVAEAVETAGVNVDDVADELGILAPPPVTSFAADSRTNKNGFDSDEDEEQADDFQKAMMESAKTQTMEIKLNVLNDTIEVQKNLNIPAVDDETVNKILESAEAQHRQNNASENEADDLAETDKTEEMPVAEKAQPQVSEPVENKKSETQNRKSPNSFAEFPAVEDTTKYRAHTVPVHQLNMDVVQSAILTESEDYDGDARAEKKAAPFKRFAAKFALEEEDESQESIDDFTSQADAKSIAAELKGTMSSLSLRMIITGISTLVLFVTTLICEARADFNTAIVYIVITLIFTLLSAAFCHRNIINGIKSIIKFKADSDSAAAVATIAVLIQALEAIISAQTLADGKFHLYGAVVTGILFVNTVGKLSLVRRISANFRFVSSREQKYAVQTYGDYNTALKLAKECVAGTPTIAYQKKAGFLKRFLELSYEPDPSEAASQAIAPVALVASMVLCIITLFIGKSVALALAALAAATCISTTVTNMIGVNYPIGLLCKKARRAGAMVVGYEGVKSVADTNAIMIDATDLFPQGTVVLGGVKSFGAENLEEAIIAATSLMNQAGGTIADVFEQVITDTGMELPKVSGVTLEDDNGVSGTVGGKLILVGSRDILVNHGITPPEREDIMKYLENGKKPLFIALDGKLAAMMVLSYKADKRRKIELRRMEETGISLIVRSVDANITPKFVGKLFDISESSVSVVTGKLGGVYSDVTDGEISRADALVATKGRVESLMSVVTASVKEKRIIHLIVAAQNIAVVLGFVLVALLSCASGLGQLSAVSIILYEIFWMAVVLLIPKLKSK
jgi:hypothetical protein